MIRTHARTHPRSHKPTRCRAYTDLTLCRARSARISHPSGSFILLGHVHHFPPLSSAGSLTTALFHFVPYRMHALSSLSSRAYFPLIPPDTLHPSRSLFLSLTTLYALPHSSFLRPVTYPLARNFFLSFTLSLTRSFPVLLVLVYSRSPASSTRVRPLLALLAFFQSLGRPTRLLRGLSSLVFLLFFPRLARFVPPDPSTNSSRFDRMSLRLLRSTILLTDTRDNLRRSDGGRLSVGHTRRVLILSATLDYTYPKDHAMRANG